MIKGYDSVAYQNASLAADNAYERAMTAADAAYAARASVTQ